MRLYVDGGLAGHEPEYHRPQLQRPLEGRRRRTWGSTSAFLDGTIDEVAVYPSALSEADALRHFKAGGGVLANLLPTASFTETKEHLAVDVDASESSDSDGTVVGYAWDFGDGTTGSGKQASHTFAGAGTSTSS